MVLCFQCSYVQVASMTSFTGRARSWLDDPQCKQSASELVVCIICTRAKVTVKPLKHSYEISEISLSHSSENMGKS